MKEEFEEERNKAIAQGLTEGRSQGLAQGMAQGMAQGIFDLGKEFGLSKAEILSRIEKKLSISSDEAEEYYKSFSHS